MSLWTNYCKSECTETAQGGTVSPHLKLSYASLKGGDMIFLNCIVQCSDFAAQRAKSEGTENHYLVNIQWGKKISIQVLSLIMQLVAASVVAFWVYRSANCGLTSACQKYCSTLEAPEVMWLIQDSGCRGKVGLWSLAQF